jgi:hypothetical protein
MNACGIFRKTGLLVPGMLGNPIFLNLIEESIVVFPPTTAGIKNILHGIYWS